MIQKGDRIISMLLHNSHDSDMTYQRPDKTTYVCQIRKNKPDTFFIPQTQLELPLDLPKTVSKSPIFKDAPHLNMLEKYYGKDHKFTEVQGLGDHY